MLSLIMPVYNEGETLRAILERLGAVNMPVPWELIVCDDGSTDGAVDAIRREWVPGAKRVRIVRAVRNRGKGAALRHGFSLAEGDILGVQDADREYDPMDIPRLLGPILEERAGAVFGTRQFGAQAAYSFWYVIGNRIITLAAGALFDRYVTDAYTCYKFFTRACYEQLTLTADGFEIEAELTGGLLRVEPRVFEIPISYVARSRSEGKKIRATDGVTGLGRLLRVRMLGR